MIARLIQFALSQRVFVALATAVLVGAGWVSFQRTPIDAFPDVSTTQVKVIVRAPGMTPEEVETRITAPIEVEILGIPRQTTLRSVTKYALCDITVDFEDGTDIYWARQQVLERLAGIWEDLPPGTRGGVAPMTTPLGEMFMFTIEGGSLDLRERRALLDWVIRPALRTVSGVADVNALGGHVETYEVMPRPQAMLAQGISLRELRNAVAQNNQNDGAGRLVDGEEVLLVRSKGSIRTLEELRAVVVRSHPIEPVRVGDIAEVQLGSLARYGAVTRDGVGEAVQGLVLSLRGANAQNVVEGVRVKLLELEPGLPEGVEIRVFYDRGELIRTAVGAVQWSLISAVGLVILVLIAFLADWRAAFTVALVLPLSVLSTFIWMRQFGLSANLMSLGGLVIAIGMLVDSAVVVIENTVSHLASRAGSRLPRLHVIYRSAREVSLPVVVGTTIIVLVFLPLLTLEGLEGKLFIPVALTIVFALISALVVSLTVLPVVASILVRSGSGGSPRLMHWLEARYRGSLEWALAHERQVFAGAAMLLVVAMLLYPFIGRIFLPTLNEGTMIVQLEKLPSISLETSLDLDLRVEKALIDRVPEVLGVVARTGSDEIGLDPMGLNQTDAFLVLRPRAEWEVDSADALLDRIRDVMNDFPGIAYGFTQPIEMRVSEMLTGVRGDVAVKLFGSDLAALNQSADEIAALLKTLDGAEDVFRVLSEGAEYLEVEIDPLAAGRLGLPVEELQERLRARLDGLHAGIVYSGVRRIPILLRGSPLLRASPLDFMNIQLPTSRSEPIPLAQVASLRRVEGPVQINREGASRLVVVTANVRGRDLVGFVENAKRRVNEDISLPAGSRVEWGGQFENQQRASARLALVVPISLGLIFLLLFSAFRSMAQAGLVLVNIPLALIGGIMALWVSGEYLSVPATIGFIALLGVAVLNGIVLVTTFNQLSAEGMPIEQVVREGAARRLRPVLMTAASTALGLAPLLIASGPGSELQRPLAIVVTGGLLSATALTLILLPILYRRLSLRHELEAAR
ncbi:MAG TPA: efflux RND transporter permease subunit [Myxococcales bacterium]|nr:efflux RND transporter permease subunit [Myxococcales bacterium]HIM00410.1 efflux RND transporter permease subunit [Myxococcales bacterium]